MKKSLKLFGILILLALLSGISIKSKVVDYDQQWSRADKLIKEGLPKSALKVIGEIYKTAKADANSPQLMKSLIYRISLQSRFREDRILNSISYFEKEIANSDETVKPLLQSLTAELYQGYYSENRWKINARGTLADNNNPDVSTWDAVSLERTTKKYYLLSLENKDFLKGISLRDYDLILLQKDTSNFKLYPTLYDLLANRTIDYLTNNDNFDEIEVLRQFDFSKGLTKTSDFLKTAFPADSNNNESLISGLFKDLIELHQNNNDTTALVDLELKRLDYYDRQSIESSDNDDIFLQSLFDLKNRFPDAEISVKISLRIAAIYKYYGGQYDVAKGEKYRWHLAKALEVCKAAVKKFPSSKYSAQCRKMIDEIESQHINIRTHDVEIPEKPFVASLDFVNINKLFFRIIKSGSDLKLKRNKYNSTEGIMKLVNLDAIETFSINLPDSKDYQSHRTEFKIPALENGNYYMVASPDSSFNRDSIITSINITVSELSCVLKQISGQEKVEMYVLNRKTGKAMADVEISVLKREYQNRNRSYKYIEIDKLYTDKNGFVAINKGAKDNYGNYMFRLQKDNDILFSSNYLEFNRSSKPRPEKRTWLFTDRAIYRPGQTVYFKGIITEETANDYSLIIGEKLSLEFKDANYKLIEKRDFTSNEYGSFNGEFIIPKGLMNGTFVLKSANGRAQIKVEEYKRPTFKIDFDSIKNQYKIGDLVQITGRAEDYAGSKVENADIKFVVKRSTFFSRWTRWISNNYYDYKEEEIANGTVKTDENGKFIIAFQAQADGKTSSSWMSYNFNVSVDATNITGETQSGTKSIRLSNSYIYLDIEAEESINVNEDKGIIISASNSSGNAAKTVAEVNIYKLETPVSVFVSRDWPSPETYLLGKDEFKKLFPKNIYKDENLRENWKKQLVLTSDFDIEGKKEIFKSGIKKLKPAVYFIEVSATDKSGNQVEAKQYFTIYSPTSSRLADNKILSLKLSKLIANPGEEIILSLSSADKKTRVFYQIMNGNKLVEQKWINISKAQKNIKILIKEEFRGGLTVNAIAIKDNRIYSLSEDIEVPWENKALDIKLETFRDYLRPGQDEEWRISIKDSEGQAAVAEILAGMYDASLDKFASNNWNIKLFNSKPRAPRWKFSSFRNANSRFFGKSNQEYYNIYTEQYPEIDWFGFEFYNNRIYQFAQGIADRDLKIITLDELESDDLEISDEFEVSAAEIKRESFDDSTEKENELIPLRTNFSETAFFYPVLKTDAEGNSLISFKTPDALTEWKIMLLAHSKDLKIGKLIRNIKARKELMVIPNLPRFVRQGDEIYFTTKVANLTDNEMNATVEIEFFDALSMKQINISDDEVSSNITLAAQSNAKVSWKLKIPENLSMISYRLKAKADNFSDGEERSFPVLTNRMLVTETLPMFINANENKTYNFSDMPIKLQNSSSIKNYKYTVELTSNPIWYAIQALPYLAENDNKSNISAFDRYYSNAISSYIVNSNPQIKNVFESWKQLTPDAFLSNLEKNEDLKSAVLQATPWVLEAEGESNQKQRIGLLFDLNKLAYEKRNMLSKLMASQLNSGAWPWFSGMGDDVYTTQKIVLGFAKLQNKGIITINDDTERARMIKKAIRFLDREIVLDYNEAKKNHPERMNNNNINSSKIQYLYLRSLLITDYPLADKSMDAFNYYAKQSQKYWLKQNNYMQGMIAIVLNRLGYRNEAEAIVRSLEERSLQSEEMGMYWRQKSGWHWYEAPVETQAMMIEAFDEIQTQNNLINQMKMWLLKQKQTQKWGSPSATVEAVYALLNNDSQLFTESKDVILKVAGKTISAEEASPKEAGSGYFKTSWKGNEMKLDLAKIELQNPNNNIAWGAAYWQYFEDLDKLRPSKSPLSIEKKLSVEKFTESGTVIEAVKPGQRLKKGQKVISRIIIRSDRDMDFVHLKDMRSSALEPANNISGYKYKGGMGYYENISDISTDFFFRYLRKGTYVLEYDVFVSQSGKFSNGIASIQSMYAPEFSSHSEGIRIDVEQ